MVVNSMQRCVFNAIASCELYGDAWGFEFNLGGYIDTYYENDNMHWHGFSDEQVERLRRAYPDIVQLFRMVALYIIGHEGGSKMQTAEDMYNRFVERAREMMHYNENEEFCFYIGKSTDIAHRLLGSNEGHIYMYLNNDFSKIYR